MSSPKYSFGQVTLNAGHEASGGELQQPSGFRILVLSDITGRENAGKISPADIAQRSLLTIDRDNLEETMERLDVRLPRTLLKNEGEYVAVEFSELDDFHPDRLFDKLDIFESLRKLRRQLMNPNLYEQAIAEIDSWSTVNPLDLDDEDDEPLVASATSQSDSGTDSEEAARASSITVDQLFDDVVANTETVSTDPATKWAKLIDDIVAPYGSKPVSADRDKYVEMLDEAIQRAMRAILHHPHFAALEAAWKSLDFFTRRVETSSRLSLQVCDVAKPELMADLLAADDLDQTQLYQLLVEKTVGTPGGKPWTLVVTTFDFDAQNEKELAALGRLQNLIATGGGCGCIPVAGTPDFWCDEEQVDETAWESLKGLAAAESMVACWPRFLCRLPYGRSTSSTEEFDFEEIDATRPAKDQPLLWAPSSILVALSLAAQFSRSGWQLDPGNVVSFDDLPLFIQKIDGESTVCEAGEFLITDKQIARCRQQGLTPLVAKREQNEVMIQGLQSVAQTPLKGAWSRG